LAAEVRRADTLHPISNSQGSSILAEDVAVGSLGLEHNLEPQTKGGDHSDGR
jgi:hypothetical protein